MLRLYNTALLPLRPIVELWAAWAGRDRARREEWRERLARRLPDDLQGGLWIHGASVGEARLVTSLAAAARKRSPELRLAVSAQTATGRARLPEPPEVDVAFFAPLDFPGLPERVLRALGPRALALVETELWPNLLYACERARIPALVVNGRLSERRMSRYRRLGRLYRPLLAGLHRVGVQSARDAQRFVELGAAERAVVVTGNIKYDLPLPQVDPLLLRKRLELRNDRPVLVAGSTGPGEEALVLDAFQQAREVECDLALVLAPRHPERFAEVARLLAERSLRSGRLSHPEELRPDLDVWLVDTLGQLAALYRIASVAFVGGSLVPVGGHNVLEPAAAGVPVLFGPHTDSVAEPAEDLLRAGGGRRVQDSRGLAEALRELLRDGLRAEMGRRAAGLVEQTGAPSSAASR